MPLSKRNLSSLLASCAALLATLLSWWLLAGVSQAAAAPAAVSPPTISGTPQVGQTLTERHATWNFTPILFAYQWETCDTAGQNCEAIAGATGQTYVVSASILGDVLRVQETAFSWAGPAQASSALTATVSASSAPSPPARIASTTSLISLQSSAVTDQTVTLIATVTSSSAAARPSGTVNFENGGKPIGGCQNEPVQATGQSETVTCQTSFAASTQQLTAAFTASPTSAVAGSLSAPDALPVAADSTTTSLAVSRQAVHVHTSETYTATVHPSYFGPTEPSQSVAFLDDGQPIPACASQPLTWTGAAALATCTVTYALAGQHEITARYLGDANFTASTSSPAALVDAVVGRLHPVLSWSFYFAPAYTKVLALMVDHAAPGARVSVTCIGRGCPSASRARILHGSVAAAANLTPLLRRRRLSPGTVVAVTVQRPGWIGKRYSFKIRASHPPRLWITCQAPGLAPGVGC